jgi:signal transduction histidine kinase
MLSSTLRVLIVDDSTDDALLLLRMLRHAGFTPTSQRVDTPDTMAVALATSTWDVVISDWSMPQFSAQAAFAMLQEHDVDVPFIIVSGTIGEETAVEALRAGAHDFMLKEKLSRLGPAVERELREAELRRAQRRLQEHLLLSERMASVGLLAAGVAHEINNPLACVMANLELAIKHLGNLPPQGPSSEKIGHELQNAVEAASRIRQIVRDMNVFARGEDDCDAPVELHPVLDLALRMASHEIRHRAHVLKDYGALPLVEGNESRLGQLFLNLLVNAAQSIREGDAAGNQIRIATSTNEAGDAVITIRDTGAGIPKELLGRLFTSFLTTKPREVGTGLGMSICQRIVDAHSGAISVQSTVGQGTEFRVVLPPRRARASVPASRLRGGAPTPDLSPPRSAPRGPEVP